MIRVLIADKHELMRLGLTTELSSKPDIKIIGDAKNSHEVVTKAIQLKPDIILLDAEMTDAQGIKSVLAIKKASPLSKIIVETITADYRCLIDGIMLGADAYLPINSSGDQIAETVRRAFNPQPAGSINPN